jgi:hypothetical protein
VSECSREKRDCEVKEEEALRGCSTNNWYQSEKILEACGDGGKMPLKQVMVAAYSMRGGGQREVKLVDGVMPLAVGGAMPLKEMVV